MDRQNHTERVQARAPFWLLNRVALVLVLGACCSGCGYDTDSERAFFDADEKERLRKQSQRDTIVAMVPDKEILELVRESEAPDGRGKTIDWVAREAGVGSGQLLFPRWQVSRRGANRYEVKYTYTFIDATNHLSRRGHTWNVDAALKLVGQPTTVALSEPVRQGRTFDQQSDRRIRDEEASLE